MEYVELLTGELPLLLNDVIRERDELIAEVQRLTEERDDAIEHADCEKQFADGLRAERDEAREAARFFRDVYVSQVGRTYPEEYMLPWEAEK